MVYTGDGVPADTVFEEVSSGYAYDDILMLPGFVSFGVEEVELTSRLTKNHTCRTPFVSSPMDTVTGSDMAIALALNGGLGILHCNNTVEEQVAMVSRVKRWENGFIMDPHVLGPNHRIADVRYQGEVRIQFSSDHRKWKIGWQALGDCGVARYRLQP
jgi:IMP dehydrogenase